MANSKSLPRQDKNINNNRPELLTLELPVLSSTSEITSVDSHLIRNRQENSGDVTFIWFDPQGKLTLNLVGALPAINDHVQTFRDLSSCINTINSSKEKIFFITSSNNTDLIATVHNLVVIEASFIFSPSLDNIKCDFPKFCGIFVQQEELFRMLKEKLDTFEQIQLESFVFEQEKLFLWSQLWKEEVSKEKQFKHYNSHFRCK